jgi:hypothetical protein
MTRGPWLVKTIPENGCVVPFPYVYHSDTFSLASISFRRMGGARRMTKKPYIKPQVRGFNMPVAVGDGIGPMGACGGGATADVCGAGGSASQFGCSNGTRDVFGCDKGVSALGRNNCFVGTSALNPG